MRVKAVIAYDGTEYRGFQLQVEVPTIQAELEQVLARLACAPVRVLVAGRTDAGVHAEGQVIAFDVSWKHSLGKLQRGMNALLPEAIVVREVDEVPASFHPRFDAVSRHYRYTIYRAPMRNPFFSRYSLHMPSFLDVNAMQTAADTLVGRHDFGAFGSPPQGDNTVREVMCAKWQEKEDWLTFDVEANAFLYRMMRILVGTLLRVGGQSLTPARIAECLQTQERDRTGPAVAAKGLCLMAVRY